MDRDPQRLLAIHEERLECMETCPRSTATTGGIEGWAEMSGLVYSCLDPI